MDSLDAKGLEAFVEALAKRRERRSEFSLVEFKDSEGTRAYRLGVSIRLMISVRDTTWQLHHHYAQKLQGDLRKVMAAPTQATDSKGDSKTAKATMTERSEVGSEALSHKQYEHQLKVLNEERAKTKVTIPTTTPCTMSTSQHRRIAAAVAAAASAAATSVATAAAAPVAAAAAMSVATAAAMSVATAAARSAATAVATVTAPGANVEVQSEEPHESVQCCTGSQCKHEPSSGLHTEGNAMDSDGEVGDENSSQASNVQHKTKGPYPSYLRCSATQRPCSHQTIPTAPKTTTSSRAREQSAMAICALNRPGTSDIR